ncbi:MFS transporter [Kribbella capetownensis]|uniref:MFS transporter n=1 Tax=Kribbella capetownensis TaxID=1572659 RepID=UPI00192DE756|nr:MFS transporter [Kribbella capetownensis]
MQRTDAPQGDDPHRGRRSCLVRDRILGRALDLGAAAEEGFRGLWVAQLGSNIGSWMQSVGAQWTVVHQPNAAALASIVQAAALLPVLFVSLPAGVLADVLDRRRLIAMVTLAMSLIAGTLAVLSGEGLLTPTALIAIIFLLQLALPSWVRARALAVYIIVFLGGQGIGALIWGLVAAALGAAATLVVSGVLLVLGAASLVVIPLRARTGELDSIVVTPWAEPEIGILTGEDEDVDPRSGPVLIEVSYRVAAENGEQFRDAMAEVGEARQRTGARRYAVFRDVSTPDLYVEVFELASWGEHLRQHHERVTGRDAELYRRAGELARSTARPPPAGELSRQPVCSRIHSSAGSAWAGTEMWMSPGCKSRVVGEDQRLGSASLSARSGWNAARSSAANSSGSSQAAK